MQSKFCDYERQKRTQADFHQPAFVLQYLVSPALSYCHPVQSERDKTGLSVDLLDVAFRRHAVAQAADSVVIVHLVHGSDTRAAGETARHSADHRADRATGQCADYCTADCAADRAFFRILVGIIVDAVLNAIIKICHREFLFSVPHLRGTIPIYPEWLGSIPKNKRGSHSSSPHAKPVL